MWWLYTIQTILHRIQELIILCNSEFMPRPLSYLLYNNYQFKWPFWLLFKTISIIYCLWFHVFNTAFFFWLRWVFFATLGLSSLVQTGATLCYGAWASLCDGFSWVDQAPGCSSPRVDGLSYSPAREIFPDPGIKPTSPALAGRFLSTAPPGKWQSWLYAFYEEKTLLLRCFYFTVSFHNNLIMPALLSEKL